MDNRKSKLYSTKLLLLPTPQIVVFYNGKNETEDVFELELKNAFHEPEKACINLKVKVININYDHNKAFMKNCLAIRQYASFVAEVRDMVSSGFEREAAIEKAMDSIIEEKQGLSEFFNKHRAEVTEVFLEEYNEDEVHQVFHDDGYDEGALDQLIKLVNKGLLSIDIAAEEAGLSLEEFSKCIQKT